MIQIKIEREDWLKAHNFAEACAETCIANYRRRGQGNMTKLVIDIHTGKLVELAAYRLLKDIGLSPTFPDFTIYESKGKSWDADIFTDKYEFHCKGQSEESVRRYGCSWLLQYGQYQKDKLFLNQKENDYLIPGYMQGEDVLICGIYSVSHIMEMGLLGMPKVHQLRNQKRAIYLEDLEAEYTEEERWGPFYKLMTERYSL